MPRCSCFPTALVLLLFVCAFSSCSGLRVEVKYRTAGMFSYVCGQWPDSGVDSWSGRDDQTGHYTLHQGKAAVATAVGNNYLTTLTLQDDGITAAVACRSDEDNCKYFASTQPDSVTLSDEWQITLDYRGRDDKCYAEWIRVTDWSSGGMSTGAKVAIGVGVGVAVGLALLLAVYCWRKRKSAALANGGMPLASYAAMTEKP